MEQHSTSSSSSYAPVLVDATHPHPKHPPPSSPTESPRLLYPLPLPAIGLLDTAYTIYHATRHSTSVTLICLAFLRLVILGGIVGLSKRWRHRGGWVAASSGVTIGAVVWEGCAGLLMRGVGSGNNGVVVGAGMSVHAPFLSITAGVAAMEYLLFLLLLRLSPPPHRSHPFCLRLPRSALQSPTSFTFQTSSLHPEDLFSPSSHSQSRKHRRHFSQRSIPPQATFESSSHASHRSVHLTDDGHFHDDGNEEDNCDEGDEGDINLSDSNSSISESSIIDLPPPLSPSRIIPPRSISARAGLDLAALDVSPILGPLVRRTRSARFLRRGFGVSAGHAGGEAEDIAQEGSYGTFREG